MKQETIESLASLNAAFYERSALAFSRTRSSPWPGWARLLERWSAPISVLDLGCGNGRFFAELSRRNLVRDYLGVDSSPKLIELAREAHLRAPLERSPRSHQARFLEGDALTIEGHFDLAVAFGLLHHLPSFELRERFVATLGRHTNACVTFWRFDRPRFQKRMLPWPYDEREPGDHLLAFGDEGPRYCHAFEEDEIRALIAATGLSEVDRYVADGETDDLNEYSVLAR